MDSVDKHLKENEFNQSDYDFFIGIMAQHWRFEKGKNYQDFEKINFKNENANGFAISKEFFGKGAERVAHFMYEVDRKKNPIGRMFVAKAPLHET